MTSDEQLRQTLTSWVSQRQNSGLFGLLRETIEGSIAVEAEASILDVIIPLALHTLGMWRAFGGLLIHNADISGALIHRNQPGRRYQVPTPCIASASVGCFLHICSSCIHDTTCQPACCLLGTCFFADAMLHLGNRCYCIL